MWSRRGWGGTSGSGPAERRVVYAGGVTSHDSGRMELTTYARLSAAAIDRNARRRDWE